MMNSGTLAARHSRTKGPSCKEHPRRDEAEMKQCGSAEHVWNEQPIGDQEEIVEDGGNEDTYPKSRAPPLLRVLLELSFQRGRECDSAPSVPHEDFDCFERD